MPLRQGRKSASQTPTPKSERIYGSKKNPKGSASSSKSAKNITFSDKTIKALQNKLDEFKEKHKGKKNITLGDLKAVYRRGSGAYSSSHRPGISRNGWAMARVNKFLLKAGGTKVKAAYVQDDDLMKMHLGGDMSKHLAPNGKASNLTHEQWHIVRTPEFKAWFGFWEENLLIDNFLSKRHFVMGNGMITSISNSKILNSIISLIPIDVMDKFGSEQLAIDMLFHNVSMFVNILSLSQRDSFIIPFMNESIIFITITRAKLSNTKPTSSDAEMLSAINTLQDNLVFVINTFAFSSKFSTLYDVSPFAVVRAKFFIDGINPTLDAIIHSKLISDKDKEYYTTLQANSINTSKVVDSNGEPLVLVRGNLINQEELGYTFDLGQNFLKKESGNTFGFFFTNNIDIAKKYMLVDHFDEIRGGSITNVFIKSNKILDLKDFDLKIGQDSFVQGLIEKGISFDEYNNLEKRILDFDSDTYKYWGNNIFDYFDVFPELRNLFIKNGFSSIIFYEMSRNYSKYEVYVAFDSNQIKLADGTNTTFDGSNPDIRYKDGGLIAPNGKKSNLTAEQYKLVRTPEFKALFGDWENNPEEASKVVDENGEPLICFHGSETKFNRFSKIMQGSKVNRTIKGFSFSDNKDVAYTYTYDDGKEKYMGSKFIKSFFLNIRKMKTYDLADELGDPSLWNDKYDNYINKADGKYDGVLLKNIIDLLQENVKGKSEYEFWANTYVVFEAKNIKLADGTNTNFDGSNPDIRYADGGEVNNCKKFILQNKSVLRNGFYFNMHELSKLVDPYGQVPLNLDFTLVSYNSGGQSGLGVIDTINPTQLISQLTRLTNITKNQAYVVAHYFMDNGKRLTDISQITTEKIVVVDRDRVVCENLNEYAEGGEVGYVGNKYLEEKYGHLKKKNAKFEDLPEVYVRVRKPRMRSGKYLPSINHVTDEKELGISVFTARYSPNSGFVFIDLNDAKGWEDESGYDIDTTYEYFESKNLDIYLVDGEVVNGKPQLIIGYDGEEIDVTPMNNYIRGGDGDRLLNTENFKIIGKLNPDKIVANIEYYKDYKYQDIANTYSGKDLKKYPRYEDGGEIKDENGYLKYTIEDDEVIIDNIKVYKQRLGIGKKLINQLKKIARDKDLPITLYAYPQDETINEDDLNDFYYSQGFELHPDDVDGKLFIYKYKEQGGDIEKLAKGKKLKSSGGGDCYYIAGQFAMDNIFSPKKIDYVGTPYLVHAEVQGQGHIAHIRYGHAWVEDDENVYDFSNGRELVIPKPLYYAIGQISTDNPKKYQKYTFAEARQKMVQTKHYGCWDLDVEYKDGGEVITDDEKDLYDIMKYQKFQKSYNEGGSINQDVTCINCGWHWDTKDSEEFDKYVCHNCGFDNTLYYSDLNDDIMSKLKTPKTLSEIAEIHKVSEEVLAQQLQKGIETEMEHTTDQKIAETIALHHIEEMPDYYDRLKEMESSSNIIKNEYKQNEMKKVRFVGDDRAFWYVISETPEYYIGVIDEKLENWQNADQVTKVQYFEDYLPKEDMEIFEKTTDQLKEGGVVVGKRHSESDENGSGERFLVKSTGQVVELEGGEGVLNKESMTSNKTYEFQGKKMSARQIASFLNHKYGGVEFAEGGDVKSVCGCKSYYHGGELPTATLDNLEGGEAIVTVKTMESKEKYQFQGMTMTPRKILSQINADFGGKKFDEGGTIDISDYKLQNEIKLANMYQFVQKLLYHKRNIM